MAAKKKKGALAEAAKRKLAKIAGPKMTPAEIAHALYHAEQRGEVERVPLEDGSWGWVLPGPDGKPQLLKPTPEMLAVIAQFEAEGHAEH